MGEERSLKTGRCRLNEWDFQLLSTASAKYSKGIETPATCTPRWLGKMCLTVIRAALYIAEMIESSLHLLMFKRHVYEHRGPGEVKCPVMIDVVYRLIRHWYVGSFIRRDTRNLKRSTDCVSHGAGVS